MTHSTLPIMAAANRRHVLKLGGSLVAFGAAAASGVLPALAQEIVIGMLPKFTSDPYFVAVNKGADEAAAELGYTVDFNGPVDANVAAQIDIIERWTRKGINAMVVSANDPDALAPAMKRAMEAGIQVMTFGADVAPNARSVFLEAATYENVGRTMVDNMVRDAGTSEGEFLIVTAVLTAPDQNRWIEEIKKYAAEKYPGMTFPAILPGDEDMEKSKNVALNYLQANPQTKGVYCVTGIAVPGVLEAVKQLNMVGKVTVTGLGVPSLIRPYLKDGSLTSATLWNPVDIGYAAVYMSKALMDGTLDPASGVVAAGRLGNLKFSSSDVVLLGDLAVFTKDNVDEFDF